MVQPAEPADKVRLNPVVAPEIPDNVGLKQKILVVGGLAYVQKLGLDGDSGRNIGPDRPSDDDAVIGPFVQKSRKTDHRLDLPRFWDLLCLGL